ncbi:MAG: hypothetical protein E6P95_00810 [Candidatus Moraniibacteriota bacterium]|nr:MAG: hypothetical protein E6P95_00810 [Candidatus Moranbacteria bacterium]
MLTLLNNKLALLKITGWLTVLAALLFELLLALWVIFLGLFFLETLLPTFITIRLSLTTFLSFLLLLTTLYLTIEQYLALPTSPNNSRTPRFISWGIFFSGFVLIVLSLARFPLFMGVLFLLGYSFLWWYLKSISVPTQNTPTA